MRETEEIAVKTTLVTILGVLLLASSANAALIHSYDLTSTTPFTDSFGGPSLVPLGGTAIVGVGYVFGQDQGLNLSNALPNPANYAIEMSFEINDTSGFRKLIDTKNLALDREWYDISGHLQFFPEPSGADTVFLPGVFVDLLVNRDGSTGVIQGFVNGVLEVQFTDSSGFGIFSGPNNIIRFFQDDLQCCGNQAEASPGTVRNIKIFDQPTTPGRPVPEPATLTLLGATGVLALMRCSFRRIVNARIGRS